MVKRILLLLAGLIVATAAVLAVWYQIDGIPVADTADYLDGPGYAVDERPDGTLLFRPDTSNGSGIVMMHGALIKPRSYARSAAFFARRGYTVLLPYGPGRMSIAAIDSTAALLPTLDVRDWNFIGHSMGGMASLEVVKLANVPVSAIALWATAMPNDYSDLDVPMLFIWGDQDGLLPPERFRLAQANLPDDVMYVTLEGANHKNFAMYSHQFFDSAATIDWMAQIDFANETTADFFDRYR